MIRIFKIISILTLCIASIVSCKKDDDEVVTIPPRAVAEQYPVDLAAIDKYLDEYNISVSADYDVTFTKITTTNNLTPISEEYKEASTGELPYKIVTIEDIPHKIYYIKFREGIDKAPSIVDSVYVNYKGLLLDETVFDQNNSLIPSWVGTTNSPFTLANSIRGWQEIFPLFKSGTYTEASNGAVTFENYGAGVMFLPSALAYYNLGSGSIAPYMPLIFTFKLKSVNYVDNDYDRIDSKDEAFDEATGTYIFSKDTDGDGRPDYLDQDDDGDNYLTKVEIRNPAGGYYDFSSIPLCSDGKKKHLSTLCH